MTLWALPVGALVAWLLSRSRARPAACGAGFVVGWLVLFGGPSLPPHGASDWHVWVALLSPLTQVFAGAAVLSLATPVAVFFRLLGRWSLVEWLGWLPAFGAASLLLRHAEGRTLSSSALVLGALLTATGSATLGLEALLLASVAWWGQGGLLYAVLVFSGVLLSGLDLWALPLLALPFSPRWWGPLVVAVPAWAWALHGLSAV